MVRSQSEKKAEHDGVVDEGPQEEGSFRAVCDPALEAR
jgi:hypothetical protein